VGTSRRFNATTATAEPTVETMTAFWWPVIARRRAVGPTEELKSWAAEITTITGQP
jgi:hypothetical protein